MMRNCFFFNDTATTEIYTLSLHDALPILFEAADVHVSAAGTTESGGFLPNGRLEFQSTTLLRLITLAYSVRSDQVDRKSTRLNSSHLGISYAVFCLKKKTAASRAADTSSA